MICNNHSISCVSLTKTMLIEILSDAGYSHVAVLVSPTDHIFVVGDVDDYEIIEIDDYHEQYIITDAGGVSRTILFHEDRSDYGILISANGVTMCSTGIVASHDDPDEFKEFVKYDTGELGQTCESGKHQTSRDSEEDFVH